MLRVAVICFAFTLLAIGATNSFAEDIDEMSKDQLKEKVVVLETNSGQIVIEFFPQDAPIHVRNFINLTDSGFYENTVFHRVIDGFMIQGGDPKTRPGEYESMSEWGTGDPGYTIDAEFNNIKHKRGIVSMARSSDPNSAGSQFFIVHNDSLFLDGQYTVFGRLATEQSYSTLDKIASLQTASSDIPLDLEKAEITSAKLVDRSDIPNILDQGEPERTEETIQVPEAQKYENKKLGIAFSAPPGWLLQEPQKTRPEIPDIIAVGPKTDKINPVISITIEFTGGRTLEDRVSEIRESLEKSIETGQLEIVSENKMKLKGYDAFVTNAVGQYESDNSTIPVKFREVMIKTPQKFYTVTYTNDQEEFERYLPQFENTLESFEILEAQAQEKTKEENMSDGNGGCLIATAAYGSELSKQVQMLRELRDNTILKTNVGTDFMSAFNAIYYSFSPTIADWEMQFPVFKEIVRISITPLVHTLSLLQHTQIDSDSELLFYGISIILLNVSMYVAFPLSAFYVLSKFRR